MKKFLIMLAMMLFVPVFADTMPFYVDSIPKNMLGLFQTDEKLNIYSHPDANSKILKTFEFSYNPETMPDGVFALLLNERKLGFLYVSDIGDEGWVEVVFNKFTGEKGWVLAEDRFQFLPWLSFYNMYGRKYGLRILKDAPEFVNDLHAKSEDLSQSISTLRYVKQIRLTAVRGNWALVSAIDIDKTPKMGYMKWRGADGSIYVFPDIK